MFLDANGDGPWLCDFCDEDVEELGRRGYIHHRDGDYTNDTASNLGAAHPLCHTRHHCAGKPGPNLGRRWSTETKAKTSATMKGRKLSDETRAKMSAARQRDREAIRERTLRAWAEGRGRNQHTKT